MNDNENDPLKAGQQNQAAQGEGAGAGRTGQPQQQDQNPTQQQPGQQHQSGGPRERDAEQGEGIEGGQTDIEREDPARDARQGGMAGEGDAPDGQ